MKYRVLKKQKNSRRCIVCGVDNKLGLNASFYELENNELVAICDTKDWHQSYPGRVHGGISAALLDETIGRAISIDDETIWGVTVSLDVKYKKPVPTDVTIKVVGRITKENRKLFEGSGEVILPNGEVAVTATAKYMKMKVEEITSENLDEDEWFLYDDIDLEYIEI